MGLHTSDSPPLTFLYHWKYLGKNIWESLEHLWCKICLGDSDSSHKSFPPYFGLLMIRFQMSPFLIPNAKHRKWILYMSMHSHLLHFHLLKWLLLDSCVCTSVSLLMRVITFHLPLKGFTYLSDSLPNVKERVIRMSRIRTGHLYSVKPTLNEWRGGRNKGRSRKVHKSFHLIESCTEIDDLHFVLVKDSRHLKGNEIIRLWKSLTIQWVL